MRYYKYRALWEQLFAESLIEASKLREEGFTTSELSAILTKKLNKRGLLWKPLNPNSTIKKRLDNLRKEGKVIRKEIMPYGFKKIIVWKYIGGEKDGTKRN